MDITMTIARNLGITPFQVMREDMLEVVDLINYYIEKSELEPKGEKTETKEKRIKVNNKTATGGWF